MHEIKFTVDHKDNVGTMVIECFNDPEIKHRISAASFTTTELSDGKIELTIQYSIFGE
jgi:hypothetical protein